MPQAWGIGTASLFSRVIVAKDSSVVQRYSVSVFVLALAVIVIFIGIGLVTIDPLFRILGAESNLIPLISDYMVIWYWAVFFFVISQNFAIQIAAVFTDSEAVIEIASFYLVIVSFSCGFQGILMLCTSSLDGINRPLVSFSLTLLRMLVLYVPLAWITSGMFGLTGIFWSAFTANLIGGSIAWFWLRKLIAEKETENMLSEKNREALVAAE